MKNNRYLPCRYQPESHWYQPLIVDDDVINKNKGGKLPLSFLCDVFFKISYTIFTSHSKAQKGLVQKERWEITSMIRVLSHYPQE